MHMTNTRITDPEILERRSDELCNEYNHRDTSLVWLSFVLELMLTFGFVSFTKIINTVTQIRI